MSNNFESDIKYVPYKEVVKRKVLEYYYANKGKISEKNKSKYKSWSPEQKKKRQESTKRWLDKQSLEKKEELRQKGEIIKKTGIKTIWYRSKSSGV